MAQIIVERAEGSLADRKSVYRVYIDSLHRGNLASCETAAFDVRDGTHSVKIAIDSYCSAPIKVAVAGTIRLTCKPTIAHTLGMMSMIHERNWISVREETEVLADIGSRRELAVAGP